VPGQDILPFILIKGQPCSPFPPAHNIEADLPSHTNTEAQVILSSQHGRVFIAIGGNMAIGFELCKILYPAGATVYVAHLSKVSLLGYLL
jgi:hypothetical protein